MEIINKILEWPIIVQGALGSFLFWLLFTTGQKLFDFSTKKIKADNKLGSYFGKSARDNFYETNFNLSNYHFFISIYGALHYFLKFVFVFFVSQVVKELVPIFAYVGYIICIYFFFRSISYVTHFSVFEKEDKKNGIEHPSEKLLNEIKEITKKDEPVNKKNKSKKEKKKQDKK